MKTSDIPRLLAKLLLILGGTAVAQTGPERCDQAWSSYNEFKARNVMEESQYALTVYGAQVRAACGADALPVPPGTDVAPYPHLRKPAPKPQQPKPAPPPPQTPGQRRLPP